jgi:hypothetical protein
MVLLQQIVINEVLLAKLFNSLCFINICSRKGLLILLRMKVLELFGISVIAWLEHYASANAGVNFQKV